TVAFRGTDARPFMPWKKGAVAGLEAFQKAAQGNGNFGFEADQDGVIRRVHLFWRYGKDAEPSTASVYPSLVAESLRVAVGARGFLVDAVGGDAAAQRGVAPGILSTKIGDF